MKRANVLLKIIIIFIISFIIINIGIYVYALITPKTPLKSANQISFYDNKNELVYSNLDGSKWIKLKNISKYIIDGTIATEDKNFYSHNGFDYARIASAMFKNISRRNISSGASTISQQYVKNLYLDFDQNWKRKLHEAYLTFELETHYSKDEILEGYLNTINYGAGNYGIENASKYYFGKSADKLNLAEASLIAGIPKNPTNYNPVSNFTKAKKRQKVVLKSMLNNKMISKKTYNKTIESEVELVAEETVQDSVNTNYYKDAVLEELHNIKSIPKSLIKTGGLNVYTNLDINKQKILNDEIKNSMPNNNLQVSSIIADPKTGKVLALLGGKDYKKSEFNRVTQAKRQVGSTIKPFLYYAALENSMTPTSLFLSEKTSFNTELNKNYSPQNYNKKFPNKEITMAAAIAFSDNIYAVKTHLFLGKEPLIDVLKKSGIKGNINYKPSLALGTNEVSMLNYANGYITLANEGIKNEPYLIRKVTDKNGNLIYEYENKSKKVLNSSYVYILNDMLSNTYNSKFRDYTNPTMVSVKGLIKNKYAVKSGSTNTDYWTVGYNKDLLVMVWNGYDNNKIIESSYATLSKTIWAKTIEKAIDNDTKWYDIPDNVTSSLVNPISGKIDFSKNSQELFFIKGTEPDFGALP